MIAGSNTNDVMCVYCAILNDWFCCEGVKLLSYK